jgi:nucleotide-binding universal stress UspA family protein
MKRTFKILLATDGSASVSAAEKYAFQFAKHAGASLTVLHVYDPLTVLTTAEGEHDQQYERRAKESSKLQRKLENFLNSLSISETDVRFNTLAVPGNPNELITKVANKIGADLIITGCHGTTASQGLFYGTTLWSVIRQSSVPVLSVPKNALFTGLKGIAFITGFNQNEIPALKNVMSMAATFEANINLVHINSRTSKTSKKDSSDFSYWFKDGNDNKYLSHYGVHVDDMMEGVVQFCERYDNDWLVVSPDKPNFHERIFNALPCIKHLSLHTYMPVLTMPGEYSQQPPVLREMFELDNLNVG